MSLCVPPPWGCLADFPEGNFSRSQRMGEEKHHGLAPKGTETPVSFRVEDCRVSCMDSTSSSSLPLRMQRRWPWDLSPGTCTMGKCHMGASTGCCFASLQQPLSLVPQPLLCGSATTPGMLPSPASAARCDLCLGPCLPTTP